MVVGGCLTPPDSDVEVPGPADSPGPGGILRFDATGNLLPLGDAFANATYLLTGHGGHSGEPNLAITPEGVLFTTAWDETLRSRDSGVTWDTVLEFSWPLPVAAPFRSGSVTGSGDPMLWIDPVTHRVFTDHLYGLCNTILWSDDVGASWTRRDGACVTPFVDHQKLVSGPPGPDANPLAGLRYPTVLYLCYNKLVTGNCVMSYDGGLTWPVERVVFTTAVDSDCSASGGHPAVRADGIVVVPRSEGCDRPGLSVSRDSGLTWTFVEGPASVGSEGLDPEVAFGPKGETYLLWAGADHAMYVARSPNLGRSWSGPWRVSAPDVRSTVLMALNAGDSGRIGVGFLGTRESDAEPNDVPVTARWHLFMVTSEDADLEAPTFTSYQVTKDESPVQVGCPDQDFSPTNYTIARDCANLGDFIDSAAGPDGTFWVAFTKGCAEGCEGKRDATPTDSRSTETAVARLGGWSLLAAPVP